MTWGNARYIFKWKIRVAEILISNCENKGIFLMERNAPKHLQ